MPLPTHFQLDATPLAAPEAMIVAGNVRLTVLTNRLLRLEYDPGGQPDSRFEDRASQAVWYRQQPAPPFEWEVSGTTARLETDALIAEVVTDKPFSAETTSVTLKSTGVTWRYGDTPDGNLLGTTRTLDQVSGATRLDPGLLSRDGWAVIDDSNTLVFNNAGWLQTRAADTQDLYFFGYGSDFAACLADYFRIAGPVPLMPRYALGNWWSRYWAYNAQELSDLMRAFREHDIPLSVCIIDMDWHLTDVGEHNGWTGYTWNRDLFPDPPAFIAWLHRHGLRTALNLHPALGVHPYEDAYPAMARRLGVDPASGETLPFDLADPAFATAYFDCLHHPQEQDGVDFWWIDWQQGKSSSLPNLDPLWWLNHLHFLDSGRAPDKRPFIFSRWGGLGNHRYPIGFSGDTFVNWETLAFQPYFTATAANVGYGWWSHDIGGHQGGIEEAELSARWAQWGVFSPIMRLHATKNAFHDRRPWAWDAETLRVIRDAMQLRHRLIPYFYTLAWRYTQTGKAPFRPIYHDHAAHDAAYHCPWQYAIGDQFVATPFIAPADPDTRLARQAVWLPDGDWYQFESGEHYDGGWHAVYGKLGDIPVFARAGAIVPLGPAVGWGGVEAPSELEIRVYAGASGRFVLFEDDGETQAYRDGAYCETVLEQTWEGDGLTFVIHSAAGDLAFTPRQRDYIIRFYGVTEADVSVTQDDHPIAVGSEYDPVLEQLTVSVYGVPPTAELAVRLHTHWPTVGSHRDRRAERVYAMLSAFRLNTNVKRDVASDLDALLDDYTVLARHASHMTPSQVRALLEVTQRVGIHHVRDMGAPDLVVAWNSDEHEAFALHSAESDPTPAPPTFATTPDGAWQLTASYFGLVQVTLSPAETVVDHL